MMKLLLNITAAVLCIFVFFEESHAMYYKRSFPENDDCIKADTDSWGKDRNMGMQQMSSLMKCVNWCKADTKCNGVVYNSNNKRCIQKFEKGTVYPFNGAYWVDMKCYPNRDLLEEPQVEVQPEEPQVEVLPEEPEVEVLPEEPEVEVLPEEPQVEPQVLQPEPERAVSSTTVEINPDSCIYDKKALSYTGQKSTTVGGKTCQRWDSQTPHSHKQTAKYMAEDTLTDASNFCRNPTRDSGGLWCYTTDENTRFEFCDVEHCKECKKTKLGLEYAGRESRTKSGKTCQRWDAQTPHQHDQKAINMIEGSLTAAENYCRNPDKAIGGPWCYTTDNSTKWEFCDIEICTDTGCTTTNAGLEYTGQQARTASGRVCERWDAQSKYTADNIAEDSMSDAENFCRNPSKNKKGVWCYVRDSAKSYEFCDVPDCPEDVGCKSTYLGLEYQGHKTRTKSGYTCARWDAQTKYSDDKFLEESRSDAGNFCRNPSKNKGGPWCYTVDGSSWETCDIPDCPEDVGCKTTNLGLEYQGHKTRTKSGYTCARWDAQTKYSDDKFLEDSKADAGSFCRNPSKNSKGPWCYTTDGSRWETCDIPDCPEDVGCKTTKYGLEYQGHKTRTKSGYTCKSWDLSKYSDDKFLEDSKADAGNFCRNPSKNSGGPWCYTVDGSKWQTCSIPNCPEVK